MERWIGIWFGINPRILSCRESENSKEIEKASDDVFAKNRHNTISKRIWEPSFSDMRDWKQRREDGLRWRAASESCV